MLNNCGVKKALSALTLGIIFAAKGAAAPLRVDAEEARRLALNREVVFVDVRSPGDYVSGHIQGARNSPSSAIETVGLPKNAKIVVYCGEDPCALTTWAAEKLTLSGYAWVRILEGGLGSWREKGFPLEKGGLEPTKVKTTQVPSVEASRRIAAGAVPIDVRPAEEFAAGHLPGALNIPLESLDESLGRLPHEADLIVYDRRADRSKQAAQILARAGRHVAELSGGVAAWAKRNMTLEVK